MKMAGRMGHEQQTTQSLDRAQGRRRARPAADQRRHPGPHRRPRARPLGCEGRLSHERSPLTVEPGRGEDGQVRRRSSCPPRSSTRKTNIPLIHQVVVAQLAAARSGTHKTKTRGEVRGGGKKPYRQKGTGRARQGSTRAPQFAGGGTVHGPVPRDYSQRTPKKMKCAALRGALSDRARNDRVHVVSSLVAGDAPSTKAAAATLAKISTAQARAGRRRAHRRAHLASLRNVDRRAPARAGPAEHLRRADQRRRGVHRRPRSTSSSPARRRASRRRARRPATRSRRRPPRLRSRPPSTRRSSRSSRRRPPRPSRPSTRPSTRSRRRRQPTEPKEPKKAAEAEPAVDTAKKTEPKKTAAEPEPEPATDDDAEEEA